MTNFILQENLKNISVCDGIIDYFNESKNKTKGICFKGVDESIKKSTDVYFHEKEINEDIRLLNYFNELKIVLNKYIEKYPYCNNYSPFGIVEHINIQHYKPNEGYFAWHTERSNNMPIHNNRHLAFTTYLNDVNDGGETEFYHQELKIKPTKGKTIIFPVDWTHTHRGITSPTEDKFIVTGWFNFIDKV